MDALTRGESASAGLLLRARRIVVKIGSSLLFDRARQEMNRAWLEAMCADIARLKQRGAEVLVVSSGAIALGRHKLKLDAGVLKLEESQAAAAVGQIDLAHAYRSLLAPFGITVAQVLLTLTDTEERRRYLNARSTLATLLRLGVVPVINENDTVATSEIRYGDNDRLAARLSAMVSADCLILLSDIDGLYTGDPRRDKGAAHIAEVDALTGDILAMAAPPPPKDETQLGSGGMVTKLEAARIATASGCHMLITDGRGHAPIAALEAGARVTWFKAEKSPAQARKAWIAGSLAPRGSLTLDDGAVRALEKGMSLLPAGVVQVEGAFDRGDAVRILTKDGREVARGLIAYASDDAKAIAGAKSARIAEILGFQGREEMIHRDDLALLLAPTGGPGKEASP